MSEKRQGATIARSAIYAYVKRLVRETPSGACRWRGGYAQALVDLDSWLRGQARRTKKRKGGL